MKAPPYARNRWPFLAFCTGMGCLFLVAATTEPQLVIQRQGDQIILSISNRPPGSVLDVATNLTLPLPWQGAITLSNNQLSLTLDAMGAMQFFRLRGPAQFDVATVAPPLNETSFSDVASATEFLYSGTNAIQTGVINGVIQPARAAVLRGRVLQRNGSALAGVRVSVLDHPEFGQTFSRGDGHYDLAVNGGFELRVNFEKTAHLPAQRSATITAQDYHSLPDVILMQLDPVVTEVALGDNSPGAVARGSTQTDSSNVKIRGFRSDRSLLR
jgi:hypothetical protein